MNAPALDLNQEFAGIRHARRMTRKEFARLTGIPASKIEKIEGGRADVNLATLKGLSRLPEGKALAARIFDLDRQINDELTELLSRATELARGGP